METSIVVWMLGVSIYTIGVMIYVGKFMYKEDPTEEKIEDWRASMNEISGPVNREMALTKILADRQNNQGFTLFMDGILLATVVIGAALFNEFTVASLLGCVDSLILLISGIVRMCEWTKTTSWIAAIVFLFLATFSLAVTKSVSSNGSYPFILTLVVLVVAILAWTRKPLKKAMKLLNDLFNNSWDFIKDPEARVVSKFKYPSGRSMSVREARKKGLIV